LILTLEVLPPASLKGFMQTNASDLPPFLKALRGETSERPPVWFMRQAGRYLPEYRALRASAPDFISFCLDPEKAAEATLQPLRRFPFSAAIIFADILLLPGALGQKVWFEAGEGPKLGELPKMSVLEDAVEGAADKLSAVGESLARVRAALPSDKALIGFAGAPWTVLTYMLERGSSNREEARSEAWREPERVAALLEVLVEATARYLVMQEKAGAQAVQIFESWAEGLGQSQFERLVIGPHRKLIARFRALGGTVPVIGFPRGGGSLALDYARQVECQGVGLDTATSIDQGLAIQKLRTIQGALDPLALRAGGPLLDAEVERLLSAWSGGPYIFNLGHGILPDTPIAHVEQVLLKVTGRTGP
jgi:uroporphyrinogen decarboxylase